MNTTRRAGKPGFFARLVRCTGGGGNALVVALVATGIAVSAAALYGSRTTTASGNAATTIGARTNQGAAGYVSGAP